MDLIDVVAYSTIVLTFAQVIWDNHKIKEGHEERIEEVASGDRKSLIIQAVVSIALIAVLVLTHS